MKRSRPVQIMLTDEEKEVIENAAWTARVSVAEYMRARALEKLTLPAQHAEKVVPVKKVLKVREVAREISAEVPAVVTGSDLATSPTTRIVRSRWDSLSEVEKRRENPARWKLEQGEAG